MKTLHRNNHGDVALCNLASVNLLHFYNADDIGRAQICKDIVDALDMAITVGECPVEEGQVTNRLYRYMGIGVTNLANVLAQNKIRIDTQESLEFQDALFDDLSYYCIRASMLRAKEFGAFPKFKETKWAEGKTPIHESLEHNPKAWQLTEYGKTFVESGRLERWNVLGQQIAKYGIRNAQILSTAPTANSAKAINATESTEPVHALFYKEEGVKNIPTLAPNIRENMPYYIPAFECNQKMLIAGAAVRQKFHCQSMSLNLYLKKADSLKELTDLHCFGFEHGIKTFYYLKQQKNQSTEEECSACAV